MCVLHKESLVDKWSQQTKGMHQQVFDTLPSGETVNQDSSGDTSTLYPLRTVGTLPR